MTGVVAKVTDKGFGFIEVVGQREDVFFHHSKLVGLSFDDSLTGQRVEFDIEEDQRGRFRAIGVKAAR